MRLNEMVNAAKKHGFGEKIIRELEFIYEAMNREVYHEIERQFVEKLDALLTEEQRLLLWEYGGGCRGGERRKLAIALSYELAGKPLSEKIELMNQNELMYKAHLNEDGTITVYCDWYCMHHRKKMPSAYGCSAGAALHVIEIALRVKAKIKSIDYPQEGNEKQNMSFIIEIV